jgi:hypothetical protein
VLLVFVDQAVTVADSLRRLGGNAVFVPPGSAAVQDGLLTDFNGTYRLSVWVTGNDYVTGGTDLRVSVGAAQRTTKVPPQSSPNTYQELSTTTPGNNILNLRVTLSLGSAGGVFVDDTCLTVESVSARGAPCFPGR